MTSHYLPNTAYVLSHLFLTIPFNASTVSIPFLRVEETGAQTGEVNCKDHSSRAKSLPFSQAFGEDCLSSLAALLCISLGLDFHDWYVLVSFLFLQLNLFCLVWAPISMPLPSVWCSPEYCSHSPSCSMFSLWVIPSSLIIFITTGDADVSHTLSLAGTVPLNSQLISCRSYSCGLPQALKLKMSFLNFWSPSMVPPFVSSPTPERNLWFVLDFYLSLNPCSTPSPHLVNQSGPADLLPEYSWTVFLLSCHYYYYSNSHQFPAGLLQCLFGRRGWTFILEYDVNAEKGMNNN